MTLTAGLAKTDITVFEPGMQMLGWGQPHNVALGVGEPLFARALALQEGGRIFAYAVADLCFVSASLRIGVLESLERRGASIAPCDVMLSATHTHTGPNGFSHAFFYDLSALGFSERVYRTLVEGIADAIEAAIARLEPARLRLGSAPVQGDVLVNRSPSAFRRNPEATGLSDVDRELLALRIDDRRGRPIGVLSLFALHATSMHAETTLLHPDHKGLAAERFERRVIERGASADFVAIFAQGAAGDVSPNVRWDARRGVMVGLGADDEASAGLVADAQVAATERAFDHADLALEGPIDAATEHVDLERRPIASAGGHRTTPARLGIAMAAGTAEGPGPLGSGLLRALPLPRRIGADDPKLVMLAVGPGERRRLLGRFDTRALRLPHPILAHVARSGGLDDAWISTVLPVQVLRIGPFAIAALPNEPTTTVGRRLRALLTPELGVTRLHVQGYSNAYAGYVTTPEEYRAQRYEGGYTLFGPHTAAAFGDALRALASGLSGEPRAVTGPPLQRCSAEVLRSRAFGRSSSERAGRCRG